MAVEQGDNVKKVKLVSNWKKLHKSFTVIMSFLGILLSVVEIILPQMGLNQTLLDPTTYGILMFSMTVAIGIGRYIQQDCLRERDCDRNVD